MLCKYSSNWKSTFEVVGVYPYYLKRIFLTTGVNCFTPKSSIRLSNFREDNSGFDALVKSAGGIDLPSVGPSFRWVAIKVAKSVAQIVGFSWSGWQSKFLTFLKSDIKLIELNKFLTPHVCSNEES